MQEGEYISEEIKISILQCGTMTVLPYEADIRRNNPLEKRIVLPVNAFLVEHPVHGNILIDTGWASNVNDILPKYLKHFYRPQIAPGQTAKEQLAAKGLRPEDIDVVLLTHLDIDHTCALKDFAGKAKRIVCAELEYFYSSRYVYKVRQVWNTWIPYIKAEDRIHYRSSTLGPVGRGFDLFGDDSILCIYTPGHTDGNFIVMINRSPSDRFKHHGDGDVGESFAVIASDAAFSETNLSDHVVPGYGFNRKLQLKSVEFLADLRKSSYCCGMFFSHSSPDRTEIFF